MAKDKRFGRSQVLLDEANVLFKHSISGKENSLFTSECGDEVTAAYSVGAGAQDAHSLAVEIG